MFERIAIIVGSWLKDYSGVIEAFAVAIASGVAVWGIKAWRTEMVGRRRAEVAEVALADFYEARDNLRLARSAFSSGTEGSTRNPPEDEPDNVAAHRNALYAPAERLFKRSEFFSRFIASQYRFIALFGEEAAQPFNVALQLRNRVIVASQMLVLNDMQESRRRAEAAGRVNEYDEMTTKLRAEIWWQGSDETDEIANAMNAALSTIERSCRPAILGR